jgi:hypothetical protein
MQNVVLAKVARSGRSSGGGIRERALKLIRPCIQRYTVHEKAQNFVVPIPLSHGWHQEQIDELFTSLLGGAGLTGAGADREDGLVMGLGAGVLTDSHVDPSATSEIPLSGLRVF